MSQQQEGLPAESSGGGISSSPPRGGGGGGAGGQPTTKRPRSSSSTNSTDEASPAAVAAEAPPPSSPPSPPPPPPPQPPAPASPQAIIRNLRDFIRRDIEPEGHRILLPFLSTRDRLRLSECSKDLVRFRSNLARIKVVEHPSVNARLKRALVQLLRDQEVGYPVCLHIAHRDAISLLSQLEWSCCASLQILDLSSMELRNKDAAYVGQGLLGGALRSLEELVLAGPASGPSHVLTPQGLSQVTGALGQGTCPQLRRLMVSNSYGSEEGFSQVIALAFESGRLVALQDLDITNTFLGPQGPSAIATALQSGSCPDLRRLSLSKCDLLPADGQTLGQAVTGGCPRLEALVLRHNPRLGHDGLLSLSHSLRCPGLRLLDLSCLVVPSEGGVALLSLLSSGACPSLQFLGLGGTFRDRLGTLQVLEAIRMGYCPELRHLDLTTTCMDVEHGRVLGEALAQGACPRLEELMISFNENLGDEGVLYITQALETGACPLIRRLDFINTGMGPEGINSLARAISAGTLRSLQEFKLVEKRSIWSHTGPLIKAFGSGICVELRLLVLSFALMSDEAGKILMEAIRDSAWPQLKVIKIWDQAPVSEAMCIMGVGAWQLRANGITDLAVRVPDPACLRWLARAFQEGGTKGIQSIYINMMLNNETDRGVLEELRAVLAGRVEVVMDDTPPLRVFSSLQSVS